MPEDGHEVDATDSPQPKEYSVESTDMHGEPSHSTEVGESAGAVVGRLRAEGLQVSKLTARAGRRLFEPRGVDLEEFAFFNAELASACKRGAPLPGALRALSRDISGRRVRDAFAEVARDVEGGTSLADALAKRGDIFPPGYVALVEAGLASGDLAGTLLVFSEEARLSAGVRQRIVSAIVYPMFIVLMASIILALAGWYFLPQYERVLMTMRSHGYRLSTLTRLVLGAIPLARWAPLIVVGFMILLPLVWRRMLRRAPVARLWGALALKVPVIGRLVRAVALARLVRTLAGGLRGKMPVPEAVTLAGLASGNAVMLAAAERLRRSVEEGTSVSDALAEEGSAFPSAVVWMLHIAEQRGSLVAALEECARLQEERAKRIGEFAPLFAAVVVTFVGGAIALVAVMGMFAPMFFPVWR